MNLPPLIGIAGRARSGKNTLANFIQAQYGGYQYAFAGPIRAMLKAGLGVDLDTPYWAERKEQVIPAIGKSPRELMQTLGTEWGRETVRQDLWLVLAGARLMNSGPGMIVTDMRFENEAAWVRRNRGVVIHLERKEAPGVAPHKSETPLLRQPEDTVIYNDLDLEALQHAVGKLWS